MSFNDIAVSIRNISKSYNISRNKERNDTFVEALIHRVKKPLARNRKETFWALQDINIEINKGDVVGIIGRNGAGKSTLLKILSRITEPTTGTIELYGRVGSLLEVGAGFHPELTGRENVFMNGSILGMSHEAILHQFDEIVDFAGVAKFLDIPVKRYSSGMYVRLAFAVAAHLNPEILIVDEVLAVGDLDFQNKCLRKMKDVSRNEGRTVIIVSHSMLSITSLCNKAVLLQLGHIEAIGETEHVVQEYLAAARQNVVIQDLAERTDRSGTGLVRFVGFHLEDDLGNIVPDVCCGENTSFVFSYIADPHAGNVDFHFTVHGELGQTRFVINSSSTGVLYKSLPPSGTVRCTIPRLPLTPGTYVVWATVSCSGVVADYPHDGTAEFKVLPGDFFRTGMHLEIGDSQFMVDGKWST